MTKVSWLLALVMVLALAGVASAQALPATPSAQPVALAAPAAPVTPAVTAPAETIDLSQIFAAPATGGRSLMPAPTFTSCTLAQCRQPCRVPGCFADCVDQTTCTCETICG